MKTRIAALIAVWFVVLAGCSAPSPEDFTAELLETISRPDRELNSRDAAAENARNLATQGGVFDEEFYKILLPEKRRSIPSMRIDYKIIDPCYYEKDGEWNARFFSDKKLTIDCHLLDDHNWNRIRKSYDTDNPAAAIAINEEERIIYVSQLSNVHAIRRNGEWLINPNRMVE